MALVRSCLGILLLADISFLPTYRAIEKFPVLQAGVSEMNSTFPRVHGFDDVATPTFWWYYPSILADGKVSRSVTPLGCSGERCSSFFLPGPLSTVLFDPDMPNITESDSPAATYFIQNDAPGYQVDFQPIDENKDPPIVLADCRVFGLSIAAVQICLKAANSSLLAGTSLKISC